MVNVKILIVATSATDIYSRFHGLAVDGTLNADFWTSQPALIIGTTARLLNYTVTKDLAAGTHKVTYGNSGISATPWVGNIFINDVSKGTGNVFRGQPFSVSFTVGVPVVTYTLTIDVTGSGSTNPAKGPYTKNSGDKVTVGATAAAGWRFLEWLLDGTRVSTTTPYVVTMDKNHTVTAVFEKIPLPGPLDPATIKYEPACTAAGYFWYDAACHKDPKVVPTAPGPAIPPTGNFLLDPIIAALGAVVQGFFGVFKWFGDMLAAPVKGAINGLIDQITDALSPGSPDKAVEERTRRLVEAYRKALEKKSRDLVKGSPDVAAAPAVAADALVLMVGIEAGVGVAALVADAAHPLKRLGIKASASRMMDMMGLFDLTSDIASMPARVGVLQPLEYWYNKQYTPFIPSQADLITMLVREVLTPEQYNEYASWHGESVTWASRRWESHWVLPGVTYLVDAYHRGIITKAEYDKYIVWHDYKPSPRPGVAKSDLTVFAGLMKTLIPRVDLRRGWELGIINDARLLKGYVDLGYEDDAPIMADIQKATALDAEITMLKREYLVWWEQDRITEKDFTTRVKDLSKLRSREWYWVQLGRLRRARGAKEPLPAVYVVPEA